MSMIFAAVNIGLGRHDFHIAVKKTFHIFFFLFFAAFFLFFSFLL